MPSTFRIYERSRIVPVRELVTKVCRKVVAALVTSLLLVPTVRSDDAKPLCELTGCESQITHFQFTPDGKRLLAATCDSGSENNNGGQKGNYSWFKYKKSPELTLWDIATGKTLWKVELNDVFERFLERRGQAVYTFDQTHHAICVAISTGKKPLVATSARSVRLWDLETGKPHGTPITASDYAIDTIIHSIAWTDDGQALLTRSCRKNDDGNRMRWWSVSRKRFVADVEARSLQENKVFVTGVPIQLRSSSDGKWCLEGGDGNGPFIRLWDLKRKTVVWTRHETNANGAIIEADNEVVTGTGTATCFYAVKDGKLLRKVAWKTTVPETFHHYSASGRRVAAIPRAGADGAPAEYLIIDPATGETVHKVSGHKNFSGGHASQIEFAPDDSRCATVGKDGKSILVWPIAETTDDKK